MVAHTDAYVRTLAPAAPRELDGTAKRGQQRFASIGCAPGHVPTLRTGDHPIEALVATPSEFRTEPLVALRLARRYLHDGRAGSIEQAIRLHGGEATRSRDAFAALSESDRKALVGFLESL